MKYKENWEETKCRFIKWWKGEPLDRPLLRVTARRKTPLEPIELIEPPKTPREYHLDIDRMVKELRNTCKSHIYMAEAFPYLDINIGPGSMATYLGSQPDFKWDTIWFSECIHDWSTWGNFMFDKVNYWWRHHLELASKAQELADDDFLVSIPDICENVDILAAMRGPQTFCYDLIDEPDLVKMYVNQIDELYFKFYDPMYDMLKLQDGSCTYTSFYIWGPGKTAKLQCDFSALMSPAQFREFVIPSLRKQCQKLDCTLYHLDGPDAVRHLDALMEIEELNVLQWNPGAGKPDAGNEIWYPIYDKVRSSGKALWLLFEEGSAEDWVCKADKIVKNFGKNGMYFLFPTMDENDAKRLIATAEEHWS